MSVEIRIRTGLVSFLEEVTYHICPKFKSEGTKVCTFVISAHQETTKFSLLFVELSREMKSFIELESMLVIQYNA